MESSSEAPIERTTISIPPNSFPQFPNSQTKSSKSEAFEKWLKSYDKTQWSNEKVMSMEKGGLGSTVAEASSSAHLRANAPPVYVGSKVGKKRSRASRKAPTTVLSTDAWNFRAMVQHFTGFPQSSSQGPLAAPTASHLTFHNNPPMPIPIPIPPPRYSSFLFHHDFNPSPLFLPRASHETPLRQTALMEDVGLNQAVFGFDSLGIK
ncbi:hypothetical protein SUGI_0815330 [Cryptomeria japonica]|nr:hypothetical protein SUGI_0815330 [Cryptomeria japonica]